MSKIVMSNELWKIYDNGDVYSNGILQNFHYKKDNIIKNMKKMEIGEKYELMHYSDCGTNFRNVHTSSIKSLILTFHGFDPVNCKECGFETDLSVCPNCGEWKNDQ